ncbi:hypothetical protein CRE_06547 [Caenorhabditis remanei]|uniref:Uncharacterized protein n=1 Tax=Caenorhabditis remanei TaxID=31234 RepID=E3M1H2_CAERE|nr:hypothetical protein CRE_06547 [Caenorhabditis remanei]
MDKTEEERMDHMKELCQEVQQHIATKKDNMLTKLREQIVSLKSLGDGKDGLVKKIEKEILEQEKKWAEQYATMEATVADLEEDVENLSSQLSVKDESHQTLVRQLRDGSERLKIELAQKRDKLQAANEDSVRDKKKIQELDEEAGPLRTEFATALLASQDAELEKNLKISEMELKLENAENSAAAAKDQVIKQMKKTAEENAKELQDLKEGEIEMQRKSEVVMKELKERLEKADLEKNLKISEMELKLKNAEKTVAEKDQVIKQMKKTAEENAKEIQDLKEEKIEMQKKSEDDELVMKRLKELLEQAEANEKKRKEFGELEKVRRRERFEERKIKKDRKMKRKLEKHEKKWGPIKMIKTDDEKEICDPSDSG